MNALFGSLSSEGLEEAQDRLGGFTRLETNSYDAIIKVAYAGQSPKGARSVTFEFDIEGRDYSETIYITNRQGENFYAAKDKDGKETGKKAPLPGFTTVDDICLVTTGEPLMTQPSEEKTLKIYDPEQRKEMPKSVPVLTDLIGKQVTLGIVKTIENVSESDGNGGYVTTDKTKEVNSIDKVFETQTKATVVEAKRAAEKSEELSAVFHAAWIEKNAGKTRDKTTSSQGGQSGRPGSSRGPSTPPQAGQSNAAAGKSLFGKK